MIKKTLLVVVGAVLLGMLFVGRDLYSYVATSVGWVSESVKDSVPIEFEIDRARRMIQDLVKPIKTNMHVIAKEEVEVERLKKEIARSEKKLAKQETEVLRLKNDLASGTSVYQYAGRTYSKKQVKADLASRFTRLKTNQATQDSLRQILSARQASLDAARSKLEQMLADKRQLKVDVENLEARMRMVQVAQSGSAYNLDDSQIARSKELISDLHTRLDVLEKLSNAEGYIADEIPLDDMTSDDIVDEVTQYFGEGSPSVGDVASSDD